MPTILLLSFVILRLHFFPITQTQGLKHARQVLYLLAVPPILVIIFWTLILS
jgi:hypothetical protein